MRLVIHAGTNKTGTTSLQDTLHAEAATLLGHGILYPVPPDGRSDHNMLTTLLQPRAQWARGLRAMPDSVVAETEALWRMIVEQARANPDAVTVLSGEFLFGMPAVAWRALRNRIRDAFADVSVVVYVREPAGYYLSRMQQSLKGSARILSPAAAVYNIRPGLAAITEGFGPMLDVRSFQRDALHEGCVVRDFLARLPGVAPPPVTVLRRNEGLSAEAACILQRLHELVMPAVNRITPATARLVQVLAALPGQSPMRLRPGIAGALRAAAAGELDWLHTNHGIAFAPGEATPATPPPGWTAERVQDVVEADPVAVETCLYRALAHLAEQRAAGRRPQH